MVKSLVVIAPNIGVRSETFIRLHMQELHPEKTAVIARNADPPHAGHWGISCPYMLLDHEKVGFITGFSKKALQKLRPDLKSPHWKSLARSFLKANNVDVIMSEYMNFSLAYFEIAQKLNIPFYVHAHGYDISTALKSSKMREKYLIYNNSAGIITISQISRKKLINIGLNPSKIHVIPCGVKVPSSPLKRTQKSNVRCLAVGRMVAKKAPIFLLEAFRKAVDHYPDLHLDYIGSGDLLPAVRQFVHAFNLGSKVTIHGGQPADVVQQYMRAADIFLQHSITDPESGDEEGLPVAILEAMSSSLPVISTIHAGIPEAVIDSDTGFLVNEGDCSLMAQKIILLAQDSNLREKLGLSAWRRSKECFTWEREKNNLRELMMLA